VVKKLVLQMGLLNNSRDKLVYALENILYQYLMGMAKKSFSPVLNHAEGRPQYCELRLEGRHPC